ncbi:TPA: hypothetical protein ACH3X1_004483 [Trebouxia sp. C0004]
MASAGSKRGRSAWEDCEDISELKQHVAKQQDQIEKLRKEKAELSKAVKAAEGQASEESPEELNAQASKIRKSLSSNINAQMVYRNKSNKSRVAADVPNLTLAQAKAVLGQQLVCKASNGAKKLEVKADSDDLCTVFPNGFSKSLRYGATLELVDV